eukprot:110399_1
MSNSQQNARQVYTRSISVPYSNVIGVGNLDTGANVHVFINEEGNQNGESNKVKCECIAVTVLIVIGIVVLSYMGYGLTQMMQSEAIGSFTENIQDGWKKAYHPNTQIDPDFFRKQHHQKTAEKIASRRIKERPVHQLAIYDNVFGKNRDTNGINVAKDKNGNVVVDKNGKPLVRNYETLRAIQKKPDVYLRHKTHPKLLKFKQKGAALIQYLQKQKYMQEQNLLNSNK